MFFPDFSMLSAEPVVDRRTEDVWEILIVGCWVVAYSNDNNDNNNNNNNDLNITGMNRDDVTDTDQERKVQGLCAELEG